MSEIVLKFNGIEVDDKSTSNSKIYLTSIPAVDLDYLSGVPTKTVGGLGFQRTYQDKRTNSLISFYANPQNKILNPLLCGIQDFESFEYRDGNLIFKFIDLSLKTHVELIRIISEKLKKRFKGRFDNIEATEDEINEYKKIYMELLSKISDLESLGDDTEPIDAKYLLNLNDEDEDQDEEEDEDDKLGSLKELAFKKISNDEHVEGFLKDCNAAIEIMSDESLKPISERAFDLIFPNLEKSLLKEFLKPMNVIDGQHRLKGYIKSLELQWDQLLEGTDLQKLEEEVSRENPEFEKLSRDEQEQLVKKHFFRRETIDLPVSIFASSDWPEHVFQFIVVNQKATSIPEKELGSMLSTTLDTKEISKIQERLVNSDIPIEDYQAITFFASNEKSPFYLVVDVVNLKGKGPEGKKYQYKAFKNLINNIRNLEKVTSYDTGISYLEQFASHPNLFKDSKVLDSFNDKGFENRYDYWRSVDGPWKEFFLRFYSFIKNNISNDSSPEVAWSNINRSNIFNEVFINILTSDFFRFLNEKEYYIESWTGEGKYSLETILDKWFSNPRKIANSNNISSLFDATWRLNSKKSDNNLRRKWERNWYKYRTQHNGKKIKKSEWENPEK